MRSLIRRAWVVAGAAVIVLGPVAGMAAAAPAASAAPITCLVLGSGFRPFTSVQTAVSAAHAGGILLVFGTCSGSTAITENLAVIGAPGATLTAGGRGPVLRIGSGARVTLSTLIITNGLAFFGGGIANSGTVTLNGSTVTGNTASSEGGGIFNDGTMTLNRSTVTGNSALAGSQGGAGIYNDFGTMTLNDSTVTQNTGVFARGGGIENDGGTITLNDSRITGNTASTGGGIFNLALGTVALKYGSRITGNTASSSGGGGIFNADGAVTGATAANITGNAPDNCAPPGSVPGCVG
jgi:hypothetical protein